MMTAEIILSNSILDDYLHKRIDSIDTSLDETKAYIHSIFKGFVHSNSDLSKESITLVYADAKNNHNFARLQNLADWIFLARTTFPKSLRASEEYYDAVARSSYYRCYVILDRQLALYEELADRFTYFVNHMPNICINQI